MGRLVKFFLIVAVVAAGWWIFSFYWQNLRGVWPAIRPPAQEIGSLLRSAKEASEERQQQVTRQEKASLEDEYVEQGPLLLPRGFTIDTYVENLGKPRVLALAPDGVLVVSLPSEGKVVALPDDDKDGWADSQLTVISGLNKPHGLAFRCQSDKCQLFVAETDKVVVYDYDQASRKASNPQKIVDLPAGGRHWTRTIKIVNFDGREKLLISVGSSCDVCFEDDWRRAKILQVNLDGSDLQEFASGLRNAVFFVQHPFTGEIWATEMGRDMLGDELPPDEINIVEPGKNYGWPLCYGKQVHDTDFDQRQYVRNPCLDTEPSYIDIPAHSAPLGLAFIPYSNSWPVKYQGDLLVAYHGSWNRTVPRGYKIKRFKLDQQGRVLGQADFISGWLQRGQSLGRPVDILVLPDGVIYISDDKAGVIYRVVYQGE